MLRRYLLRRGAAHRAGAAPMSESLVEITSSWASRASRTSAEGEEVVMVSMLVQAMLAGKQLRPGQVQREAGATRRAGPPASEVVVPHIRKKEMPQHRRVRMAWPRL